MILLLALLLASTPGSFPTCQPGKGGTLDCRSGVETVDAGATADKQKVKTYKVPKGYVLTSGGRKIVEQKGKATIEFSVGKNRKVLTCRWTAKKSGKAGLKAHVKGYCTAVLSKI